MMQTLKWVLSTCLLLASVVGASAANVEQVTGVASVNKGDGYTPISVGQVLDVGNLIQVAQGGSVTLQCSNGAQVTVKPGAIFTVTADCAAPAGATQTTPGLGVTTAAVAGGIAITGAIVVIAVNNANPASP